MAARVPMILAGDIGGTKTLLALFEKTANGDMRCVKKMIYACQEYPNLDAVLDDFLPEDVRLDSACFGIAGPVLDQRCQMTNLSWCLDGQLLKVKLGTEKVRLLNDLEAMAVGMLHLPTHELAELNNNAQPHVGNIAVIAAGTGLGEAILYWDGTKHHPIATEGGHSDFAPQNAEEDRLMTYMRKLYPDHVSWERVLWGTGFSHLYDFLCEQGHAPCADIPLASSEIDRNALISELGIKGDDPTCAEAVKLYVRLYGAEAGNMALKCLSLGGVLIGGGIAPKILDAMQSPDFLRTFTAKGRYQSLLEKMSIKVCLNPQAPLLGAAHYFD